MPSDAMVSLPAGEGGGQHTQEGVKWCHFTVASLSSFSWRQSHTLAGDNIGDELDRESGRT